MKRKILSLLLLLTLLLSAGLFGTSTVFADGTEGTCKVNFMLDKDTLYQTATVQENSYLDIPETPYKTGSVFLYWQTENGDKFSFTNRVTENLDLYAKWDDIKEYFTVTFMVDGDVVSVQEVEKGGSAIEPNNVVCPEGKTFLRWSESTEHVQENITVNAVLADIYYTVSVYADEELIFANKIKHGEDVTFLESLTPPEKEHYEIDGFIGQTENIVSDGIIYVNYLPVSYNVSYLVEDETYFSSNFTYGETAPMPTTFPEKEGYLFVGWYLDEELFNFNTVLSKDTTLTARFVAIEKPKYSVTFYDYNGNQYGGVQIIEEGQSAILPGHPIREGYTFIGWNKDFNCVTEDLEIYPTYSANTYTVTVKDYSGVIATYEVSYGQSITVDTALVGVQTGYEFIGFDGSFKNITKDTVINARYRAKSFVVRFYTDNLQAVGGMQNVNYGNSAKAPKVSKDGFNFIGWKNLDTGVMNDYQFITEHSNYVAVYERITYTVTFMEGTQVIHTETVEYGRGATMYSYEKQGYVFGGWFWDNEYQQQFNFIAESIYGDVTVYAKWTEKVNPVFTATFLVDGETYNLQQVEQYKKVITPSMPVKEGYVFKGWTVDGKGYSWNANEDIGEYLTENLTFIAEFERITYTVKFVYAGYSYEHSVTVNYGEPAVFPPEYSVEKEGYEFIGWDKDTTCVKSNMTVNALYKANVYTVTFVDDQGNEIAKQTVEYGAFAQIVSTPKKEGHTFTRWFNLTDLRDYSFDYAIKKDTSIRAEFDTNSYALTYYIDGMMYRTYTMVYGQVINVLTPPSYNPEEKVFLGWSEVPEKMPANNFNIYGTSYTYQFYNLSLYIDGQLYKNFSVREGKDTPIIYNPTNLPETIIFKSWGEVPSVMPNRDVRIDADIEKLAYYKLYYYVEDSLFTVETVLQGKSIYNLMKYEEEVSAMFDETKVFKGWDYNGNDKMPASDLVLNANIQYKSYYKLNYYVNGVLYKSFRLLEGTTIEDTEYEIGAPTGLPENMIFNGWSTIPEFMPKNDFDVNAYINVLEYFTLTYMVDGEIYKEFEVLEGSSIPKVDDPVFDGTKWFVSWLGMEEVMPERNLTLSAELIYLNNIITERRDETDDNPRYYLDVKVTGVVNFVAIKLNIDTHYADEVILDERYASYNFDNHTLVYASGEIITEEITIATFVGDTRLNYNTFSSIEIYTINESGEIVKTVCHTYGNKI